MGCSVRHGLLRETVFVFQAVLLNRPSRRFFTGVDAGLSVQAKLYRLSKNSAESSGLSCRGNAMNMLSVRINEQQVRLVLRNNQIARAIADIVPFKARVRRWGDTLMFPCPLPVIPQATSEQKKRSARYQKTP